MSPAMRRSLAAGLLVLGAALVTTSAIALSRWQNYVYLSAFRHIGIAVGVACLLLVAALALLRPRWRTPVYFVAAVLALGSLLLDVCAFGWIRTGDYLGEAAYSQRYAVAEFEVSWFLAASQIELRVRSHQGLLSREGETIACFAAESSGADPRWRLDRVRFTGEETVEVTLKNGEAVAVAIDPATLGPRDGRLDRCTDANYPD